MVPAAAILVLLIVMAIFLPGGRLPLVILAAIYGLAFVAGLFVLSVYLASAYVYLSLSIAKRQSLSLAQLKTVAWAKMWYIFIVNFLVGLINQVVTAVQIIPLIGAVISLVLSVLISAFMAPATYILVDQNQNPIEAMKDSYNLVRAKGHMSVFVKMVLVFTVILMAAIMLFVLIFVLPAVMLLANKLILLGSIWITISAVVLFVLIIYSSLAYQICLAKRYLQVKPAQD